MYTEYTEYFEIEDNVKCDICGSNDSLEAYDIFLKEDCRDLRGYMLCNICADKDIHPVACFICKGLTFPGDIRKIKYGTQKENICICCAVEVNRATYPRPKE